MAEYTNLSNQSSNYQSTGIGFPNNNFGAALDGKTYVGASSYFKSITHLLEGGGLDNYYRYLYPGMVFTDAGTDTNPFAVSLNTGERYRTVYTGLSVGDPTWDKVRDDNKRFWAGVNDPTITPPDYALIDDVYFNYNEGVLYKHNGTTWEDIYSFGTGTGTIVAVSASSSNAQGLTLSAITTNGSVAITLAGTVLTNLELSSNVTGTLPISYGGTGQKTFVNGVLIAGSSFYTTTPGSAGQVMVSAAPDTPGDPIRFNWVAMNTGTVTSITAGTGLSGGTITSSGTIALTGQALALHSLSNVGFFVRTGTATVAARSIAVSSGLSISNGNGVGGNPVITHDSNGTAGSYGPSLGGTLTFGSSFTVPYITTNAQGHVSAASTMSFTLPITPNNYYYDGLSWTGGKTNGPIGVLDGNGTTPNVTFDAIPYADGVSASGIVTTDTQSFGGLKTFITGLAAYGGAINLAQSDASTVNIGGGLYNNAINIGTMTGDPETNPKVVTIGNGALETRVIIKSGVTNGLAIQANTSVTGNIAVSGYAKAGIVTYGAGAGYVLTETEYTISLASGNTHFFNFGAGSESGITIYCTHTQEVLYDNYLGGSFIITIYNNDDEDKTIIFSSARFKGITTDPITLAPTESLTYSGMILGTGITYCDFYGIISDGIANLKL